ncbi:hypothetical protein [Microcoleus sp. LEGE 07076]|uniref:hypothetical protein n=1 Tax=Microcoleus sp. LEGE 07076 TaxID=915322 RepID=UPI00187E8343|nr:hypothetical protein [Microcoleus sp. LEGE 07076]
MGTGIAYIERLVKNSVERAFTGSVVLVAHPIDCISQSPAPSKIASASFRINEGWRWAEIYFIYLGSLWKLTPIERSKSGV